jgi:hypothetical protein
MHRGGLWCLAAGATALTVAACGSHLAATSSAIPSSGTTGPAGTTGSSPAARASASAAGLAGGGPALCADVAGVTRLVVSRVNTLPQNHQHFAFPAGVTVADPVRARAVAKALCALPAMPSGTVNCPNNAGVDYRLSFAAGQRSFPAVMAEASGCTIVNGIGTPRTVMKSAQFWTTLTHAMGVSGTGSSVVRGTLP